MYLTTMKLLRLFSCFFLLMLTYGQAQQINFAIQHEGENLGFAEVWIDKTSAQQTYAFQLGEMLVFPIEVSSITSMYEGGKLLSASSTLDSSHVNIKGDGQYYHSMCQGTYEPLKSGWVHTGLAKLFCERPKSGFALIEAEGEVKPIERVGTDSYEIQLNNGAEITFTYKSDDCVAVHISQEGKEWKLTRVQTVTM